TRVASCPRRAASRPSPSPSPVTRAQGLFCAEAIRGPRTRRRSAARSFFDTRLPIRQRRNHVRELLGVAARFEPVADVAALLGAIRPRLGEVENSLSLGDAMQSDCNLSYVVSTSFVVMADDDHIGAA